MVVEILALVLGILLLLLANYTEKRGEFRAITQVFLALVVVLATLEGLLTLEAGPLVGLENPKPYGYAIVTTGLISSLLFLKPVRRVLARAISIDADNWLHATALVFAALLVGMSLATVASTDVIMLGKEYGINTTTVVLQDSIFVVSALVGVGWLTRRSWREVLERLGLAKFTLRDLEFSIVFAVLLFAVVLSVDTLEGIAGYKSGVLETKEDPTIQMLGGVTIFTAVIIAIASGVGEEALFRGAMQPRFGIVLTSLLFAIVHVQYWNLLTLGLLFLVGLILGYERRMANTAACAITHAGYNMTMLLVAALA